ncbi:hypothetical protein N9H39_05630 [Gammaproteobacteria bacterium]|nr:hypothetical protein [Gammaproteobacteria bacterium]
MSLATLGRPAELSRGDTADAAEHPCEIAVVLEPDGSRHINDFHSGGLQQFLRRVETNFVDQRTVGAAMIRESSCSRACG